MYKRILVSIALLGALQYQVSAQRSSVESAIAYLRSNELDEAKKYIDEATENEETKNEPKTHYVRGRIYQAIHNDTIFNKLDKEACIQGLTAYIKCIELDKKKKFEQSQDDNGVENGSIIGMVNCSFACYQKAAEGFDKKDWNLIDKCYDLLLKAIPLDNTGNLKQNNITETQILLYSSYASENSGNTARTMDLLGKLIAKNYMDVNVYIRMELSQLRSGDTAAALKTIGQGRSLFPENKDLMNEELRIYQTKGDLNALLEKLTLSLQSEPDNSLYLTSRGNVYSVLQAKNTEIGKLTVADSLADLSVMDFKRALVQNPNDTFALYSMGLIYMTKAKPILDKINGLNDKAKDYAQKRQSYTTQLRSQLELAKPYLDQAYELKKTDKDIVMSCYQMYSFLGNVEKTTFFKKEMETLKGIRK